MRPVVENNACLEASNAKPLIIHGLSSEKLGKNLSNNVKTQDLLRQSMAVVRTNAVGKSMRGCGCYAIPSLLEDNKDNVPLAIYEKNARFLGLAYCNSQWCPSCMNYSKPQRVERIRKGLKAAIAEGFKAYFITLTTPRSLDPEEQIAALMEGFKYFQDKIKDRLKKMGAHVDFVRSLDVTFKLFQENIYHSHLHIILVVNRPFVRYEDWKRRSKEEIDELGLRYRELVREKKSGIYPRYKDGRNYKIQVETIEELFALSWHDVMASKGINVSLEAQHIEEIDEDNGLSSYLNKFEGLGMELVNFQHKSGKKKKGKLITMYDSIGYMELLGYVAKGLDVARIVLQMFLCAVYNKRTMDFSRTWKDLEALAPIEEEEPPTVFYDCDGELIDDISNEKLYEVDVPIEWFSILKSSTITVGKKFHFVIDVFPIAAYKAFHLGEVSAVEHLLSLEPYTEASGYALERFLLKYWKEIGLPMTYYRPYRGTLVEGDRKPSDVSRFKDYN